MFSSMQLIPDILTGGATLVRKVRRHNGELVQTAQKVSAEQIRKLKDDVAAEAEALSAMRTNSGLRRPTTNSRQVAAASDEDATVALDTGAAGLLGGADNEATVALDTSAAGAMLAGQGLAPAKKSNTGLIVGLGVVVAIVAVAGGLVASGAFDSGKKASAGGAVGGA